MTHALQSEVDRSNAMERRLTESRLSDSRRLTSVSEGASDAPASAALLAAADAATNSPPKAATPVAPRAYSSLLPSFLMRAPTLAPVPAATAAASPETSAT